MRGVGKRLQRLESRTASRRCGCVIRIVEVEEGEAGPPLPPCPKCERSGLVRIIEVVRPAT